MTDSDDSERPLLVAQKSRDDVATKSDWESNHVVPDRYHVALLIFAFLGFGSMVPFNLFISASDFYHFKFRNTTDTHSGSITTLERTFESSLAVASPCAGLVLSCMNTYLTTRVSFQRRMYLALLVTFFVYASATALSQINTDSWQLAFFSATVLLLAISSGCGSTLTTATYGIAGFLPRRYTTAFSLGQALAGVVTALAVIFGIVVVGRDRVQLQALIYFALATGVTVGTLGAFALFLTLDFTHYHVLRYHRAELTHERQVHPEHRIAEATVESDGIVEPERGEERLKEILEIFLAIWPFGVAIALNFFMTLAVFPGLLSLVASTNAATGDIYTNELFVPLTTFLLFNSGDACGRYSHGFMQWPDSSQRSGIGLLLVAALRCSMIALFLFCNVQPRHHMPVLFGDGALILFTAVAAFSNGYICNACLMLAPTRVPTYQQESAGSLMSTLLYVGLAFGGALSFVLVYAV